MLVTALNLLPVGQLDGGHITYALFSSKHKYIARTFFVIILTMGIIGLLSSFGFGSAKGQSMVNWLVWAILIFFLIRVDHPPFYDPEPIGGARKLWGAFALFIFVTSFTPIPFSGI
jgi:membrane-associated protease RseP (regulator of RpoE activity)